MRAVGLHDDIAPVAQGHADRHVVLNKHRDLEASATDPPQPPLQTTGMKDRAGMVPLARTSHELEDGSEIPVTLKDPNAKHARLPSL
jgi:hypothetical protein